jgi:UPF0755 protein
MGRLLLALILLAGVVLLLFAGIPAIAARVYGPPSILLTPFQTVQYSALLLWDDGLLTRPLDAAGSEKEFQVGRGESVTAVCARLQADGIVIDGSSMRDYLVYTGQDTSIQAGSYRVSAAMSVVDLARRLQDATPNEVRFVVLPGWRIEEIAASLPSSGLSITPDEFVASASASVPGFEFLSGSSTTEGFLYPDSYVLKRATGVTDLIGALLRNFSFHVGTDLQEGFARQGLSLRQAVILASIVQREAVQQDEAPVIASVYLNRLKTGMRLDADPTVQYAAGYNAEQGTWWTNPLSSDDLHRESPYNTYLNAGLPPAPIDNPGAAALLAVASPAATPYLYFSARCDSNGYHFFAQTLEEQISNLCP